jgi:hypothetical protein
MITDEQLRNLKVGDMVWRCELGQPSRPPHREEVVKIIHDETGINVWAVRGWHTFTIAIEITHLSNRDYYFDSFGLAEKAREEACNKIIESILKYRKIGSKK